MAEIEPFNGVRYNTGKAGFLEDLITPPYDVIDRNQEASFLHRNPYNIIRLDLPKSPGRDSHDSSRRHRVSAETLRTWLKESILCTDPEAGIYPYDVSYRLPDGSNKTRKGFICLVKLHHFSEGIVKPHEETFASVIQDRLDLTRACQAQFSQVFSLFSDPDNQVIGLLDAKRGAPVSALKDRDGNEHRLWRVIDGDTISSVRALLQNTPLYIADGHHRYTTALAYRDEKGVTTGPESMIMMYLCPMEDPGLTVLPTHRVVTMPAERSLDSFVSALKNSFDVTEISGATGNLLARKTTEAIKPEDTLVQPVRQRIGLYVAGDDRAFILSANERTHEALSGRAHCLQALDVVLFNDVIVKKVLGLDLTQCERGHLITYHSDVDNAVFEATAQHTASSVTSGKYVFLLNGATVRQVQAVSDAGLYMPHKSTYFYPKVMTGLVLNVFDGFPQHGRTER